MPIEQHIDERCKTILERILKDEDHATTIKLGKSNRQARTIQTRSIFNFEAPLAKHERYNNSFVPKTLRTIRDGRNNMYKQPVYTGFIDSTVSQDNTTCSECGRTFKKPGIKIHMNKCIKSKTVTNPTHFH